MKRPTSARNGSKIWLISFSVAGLTCLGFAWWADLLPNFGNPPESEGRSVADAESSSRPSPERPPEESENPPLAGVTQWEPEVDALLVRHSRSLDERAREEGNSRLSDRGRTLTDDEELRISRLFDDDKPYFADDEQNHPAGGHANDLIAASSGTERNAPARNGLFSEIDALLAAGETLQAHRELSLRYWNQPEQHADVLPRIRESARMIYHSPRPHFMQAHEVQPGDTLQRIAGKYHVSWEYLARLNGVAPERIRPGQKLKVIKGPFSAFVDLSDFRLTIHAHGYFVKEYAIGIGKDNSTPLGTFKVREKLTNPVYYPPEGGVVAADDPANPLGERWIGLGDGYGIHGTIDPDSIGRAESKGCLRLNAEDIAEVYDFLTTGSEVAIRP
jgi:LysM repeat protein